MKTRIWEVDLMKKYFSFFKNALKISLEYKFEIYMWLINSVIQVLLYFFLWRAIFENQDSLHGYTLNDMVSYILIATLINRAIPVWHWGDFFSTD